MNKVDLDQKLAQACDAVRPDLDKIKELIMAGADPNQRNFYGDGIFESVFLDLLYDCEDEQKKAIIVEKTKEIIQLMIDNGWDTKTFGLEVMNQFVFSTYDRFTFELYRFMLQYDLTKNPKDYEEALESVGTEESYQSCEGDHELENLFYAIYEMVEAKMEGRDYKDIESYYDATGMTIDKILYFDETNTMVKKDDFTEYNADIGFVCGNKVLVLRDCVNILFMNGRLAEQPQIDVSAMFSEGIIGEEIEAIDFAHKEVHRENTTCVQPTIILRLANGRQLKFSHNFGELPNKKSQSRFWID